MPKPNKTLVRVFAGTDPGTDSPDVIRLQPLPIALNVLRVDWGGLSFTAIARQWAEGDAARCRLCPAGRCGVGPTGVCLVIAFKNVPAGGTPLYEVDPASPVPPPSAFDTTPGAAWENLL